MKYPKYKRHQKLSAKLSNKQVEEIREIRKTDLSYKKIADMFNVSTSCIFYVCMDKAKLKEVYKKRAELGLSGKYKPENRNRKIKLQPEIKKYNLNRVTKYYKKNKKLCLKKQRKKYREDMLDEEKKEKIYKRNLKWREENREYERLRSKRYRLKLKKMEYKKQVE